VAAIAAPPLAVPGKLAADLEAVARRLRRVTVLVGGRGQGAGAGIVWGRDGLVVTNAHVARGPVGVTLADGRRLRATLAARDPERDLAALALPVGDLEAAEVDDGAGLRVGQLVLAVGHPLGLAGALSIGILHRVPIDPADPAGAWLVADLRLAPGNSGGPLADERGRVLGVNAMIQGGLALAVPTVAVRRFLRRAGLALR
jgi:serine protease Do